MVRFEKIPKLSEAELDALPQGVIRLDKTGKILILRPDSSRIVASDGRDDGGPKLFTDVALCTAVSEFQGRFNDFFDAPAPRIGLTEVAPSFRFELRFAWGSEDVSITMVKTAGPEPEIYLAVEVIGHE
jgi:photoactive yellow protein